MDRPLQTLEDIVANMKDWPNRPDLLRSSLLFLSPYDSLNLSAVVCNEVKDDPPWELVHLSKRHVPYFGRQIWHYYLVADGPHAAFEGFNTEPSEADITNFVALRRISIPAVAASTSWVRA